MARQQPSLVDPKIWQCCAGDSVEIPKLHSKVYYFPLGHLEHANPTPNTESLSIINGYRPFVPCIVSSVDLLVDPQTDEVFTKLMLTPIIDSNTIEFLEVQEIQDDDGSNDVVSSGKILSQSDANNGGAFSVPSKCAKLIFPQLDVKVQLPSQDLKIYDLHGDEWDFRHVYRGNPKRHLITTNWSPFVDKKKLVGGDFIVLMKNSAGKIFVGIRRFKKFAEASTVQKKELAVMEAAELAEKNKAFEVVYYPAAGDNFVVDAKVVEDAMKMNWSCGMRVKLSLKKDDSSTLLQHGTILNLSAPSNRPWHMLQVKWDESKVSKDIERISPWQVEYVPDVPTLDLQYPPAKKLKVDVPQDFSASLIDFNSSSIKSLDPTTSLNCYTLSDGMQEARHNPFSNSTQKMYVGVDNCNTIKVGHKSIKLLGTIIQVVESDLSDSEIKEDDNRIDCNEIENIDKTCTKIA